VTETSDPPPRPGFPTEPDGSVDEGFRALMEGLRTTLPGVQVLFAFLLILPLQARFATLSPAERVTYFVALVSAAVSSVLLIAPSVHQRVRAPMTGVIARRHRAHLRFATNLTIVGTIFFLVSLGAAVHLVTTLVFSAVWAILTTTAIVVPAAWAWFYIPVIQWREHGRRPRGR
jgi:hypothetical protein